MRIGTVAENPAEWLALALGLVPSPICDVLIGPMLAKAVMAGSALHVFDALEGGPLPPDEVAARCGSDPDATARLLRALSASKYLKCHRRHGRTTFGLTKLSRRWLLGGAEKSLHHAVLHRHIDMRFMDFEGYVRSGRGQEFHDELGPEEWIAYHAGQAEQARLISEEVVRRLPVPDGATRMLDLGGGHGHYSHAICERYAEMTARVLDLAIPLSAKDEARTSLGSRVTYEVSDIRTTPLADNSADVILIANVMHHFDEATNRCLFSRAARALTAGGILVALDLTRPALGIEGGQIVSLMDLYFGAASGAQLWSVRKISAWQVAAGLRPLPAVSLRMLPDCKIQVARKP